MDHNQKPNEPGIFTYYKPTKLEKEKRDLVYDRKFAMESSKKRKDAEKIWRKGREQWEAMRKDRKEDEWQSNHYVPTTIAVVESAMSEMIDQSPAPQILPRGSEDNPKASIMEHAFKYSWEISDSDLAEEDILHDALICGTGIGQEYYFKDIRKIQTKRKGKSQEYEEEEMVDYDDVLLDPVKLEDFLIDENARDFKGPYAARDCGRRYIMNMDDFKNFFKGEIWDPLGNAKYVQPGGDTNYYERYKPPQGIDHSKQVEVFWYWQVKPEDWLIIVANDVVVVMGPNPYKHKQLPFARAIDVKRTHEFYGKGEPEILESIQDEMNTFRRMVIDRNHLDIDKMFYGSNRLNLSDEDTIARPHGFIPVGDADQIKAVEYGDIPRSVELSIKHLEDDSTIATGINPRAQALPTTGTATEAAILKESTLKRLRLKVRRFEREFLVRIARLRVSNILQFYSQPKLEDITGEAAKVDFQEEMKKLEAKGLIIKQGKQVYKKKFKEMRLEGKEMNFDTSGNPRMQDSSQAFSFFELMPEYFMPNKGGYDIKITAGSTLPVSKALMDSKIKEVFDRLSPIALQIPGSYDIKKLGDLIARMNDINPSDISVDAPEQSDQEARLTMLVDLANQENKMIMQGQNVQPLEYSSPVHTAVHVQYMSSPDFQALESSDPRVQVMTNVVTGELAAQAEREGMEGGLQGQMGGELQGAGQFNSKMPNASGGANNMMKSIMPDKVQGGGQVSRENPGF